MNATPVVVHFHDGGICMASANLLLIASLALIVWRIVFARLKHGAWARGIAAPRRQRNSLFEQGLNISERAGVAVMAGNHSENSLDGVDPIHRKSRARSYLLRIVALTGATQVGNCYVLDVGKARLYVRNGYISRISDLTDSKCACEETCFYPVHEGMPKVEEIATALLQLKNNPVLFDRWAAQSGAFKADGQGFSCAR